VAAISSEKKGGGANQRRRRGISEIGNAGESNSMAYQRGMKMAKASWRSENGAARSIAYTYAGRWRLAYARNHGGNIISAM